MKKITIIITLVASLFTGLATTSCSDMLSPDSERHSYEVAGDTLYSYWGILRSMQNIAERTIVLGECRGELVDGSMYVSDSIRAIMDYDMEHSTDGSNRFLHASDYYHLINSCNAYLASVDRERLTGTNKPYMLKEVAQVEAIRAWTYLQLIQIYGEVPFYTDPLLTTDDINNFANNPNQPKATASNLADLLMPFLNNALAIEKEYGFPNYEKYGYTEKICHSTKAMIPLNLIMADLYLTKGDKESCTKAAQHYYDYLSNNIGTGHLTPGGALPNGYNFYSIMGENDDKPRQMPIGGGTSGFWTENGEQKRTEECITGIASSTNKLWGHVLRGIPELLGYASEISVSTNEADTSSTADIFFTPQYDKKQIAASPRFFNLCKEQTFESYVGSDYEVRVIPNVGDGREYWVKDVTQTYDNGLKSDEKFIVKNHPKPAEYRKRAAVRTILIPLYRKASVWLRYAEALNRAGYPSYAFAILKNGLCSNRNWIPEPNTRDYAIRDSAFRVTFSHKVFDRFDKKGKIVWQKDDKGKEIILEEVFPADLEKVVDSPYEHQQDIYDKGMEELGLQEQFEAILNDPEFDAKEAAKFTLKDFVTKVQYEIEGKSFENYPSDNCEKILDYLDAREVLRNPTFLNYNQVKTLEGNYGDKFSCPSIMNLSSMYTTGRPSEGAQGADNVTVGIHSRGCGLLRPEDMKLSTYNYVSLVQKLAAENYGVKLTKDDIYYGTDDETVQKCVEDLIVQEEALELAFEGTRFFDLMRVAHRRNDPQYLAARVCLRSGEKNESLFNKLCDPKNWYFPLPNK